MTTCVALSVIIVTHNSAAVIDKLLGGLPTDIEIICVDNASADEIALVVKSPRVKLIRNSQNLGYGAACNRGAAVATGEFLFFVNPDIRLFDNSFTEIISGIDRYPDCAVFSPRIESDRGRGENRDYNFIEKATCPRLVRLRSLFTGDCCVHFLHGGAFIIKRATFRELDGFDERIFLYYEDDDLSARLLAKREPIVYLHSARVRHSGNQSALPTLARRFTMSRHKKRSEIYVRRKYGIRYYRVLDIADLFARVVLYAVTLNPFRLFGAAGRLCGALSAWGRNISGTSVNR